MYDIDNLSTKKLIVLEIANNHQGDVDHAKDIIDAYYKEISPYLEIFDFAFKFQYRDLQTFIHKQYQNSDKKFVQRFNSTKLSDEEFLEIIQYVRKKNILTMCTPFDELSVKKVIDHGYDILKIASASMDDWPLIEQIGKSEAKNIIFSVGGSELNSIKKIYSYFKNKQKNFAINYCVSLYPTNSDQMNLSYIKTLIDAFPKTHIGFSTHESGEEVNIAGLSLTAGAKIFEKHIALENLNKDYSVNKYSCTPSQFKLWLQNLVFAESVNGSIKNRNKTINNEKEALRDLKRGVFVSKDVKTGEKVLENNIYYSIPSEKEQLLANDLSMFNEITFAKNLKKDELILYSDVTIKNNRNIIEKIRDTVSIDLTAKNIVYPKPIDLEVSHHYGIEQFYEFGTCMITLINKDYCKKIIYQFPGQTNPEHFHKIKEETFVVLDGSLEVIVENVTSILQKGDILTIPVGSRHSFTSKNGAIFEEISTEHHTDDSYYTDEKIVINKSRKSKILMS